MNENTLRELFVDELRDLYDAENRLVKALPKLAKAANLEDLRSGFETHLEQTKEHVERLKQIMESLDEKPTGKKCPGMIGIIQEGEELIGEEFEGSVMDAALISAAQRAEHYEIAAYGCVHAWAKELGEDEAAELLEKTLTEEKETDAKLTEISEQVNPSANSGAEEESEEEEEERGEESEERATPARRGKARSARAD
jgi:ferritin-like metal-binding protein YciE